MSFIFSTPVDSASQILGIVLKCAALFIAIRAAFFLSEFAGGLGLKGGASSSKNWCFSLGEASFYLEAKAEEKSLIEAFSEEYESYRASSGMFPKVSKSRN